MIKLPKFRQMEITNMNTKSNVKVGGVSLNHNQAGIAVKTATKAGGISLNHNQSGFAVKTATKAGGISLNHNQSIR